MDLRRLPYLPIQYFFHQFSKAEKAIFIGSLLAILAAGIFLAVAYTNPTYWSMETYVLQSTHAEEAVIGQVEANYRSFDVSFPVYWQKMIHAAGPILPGSFPFLAFAFLQVLSWTFVITAITKIKSRWIYLFYFIFLLFIHFSGVYDLWYKGEGFAARLVEFGIILSYLIPAYLFQVKILKWPVLPRFLIFVGLSFLWFGVPLLKGEILDAHGFMQDSFYFNIFLLIPFVLFASKELVNLIVLVGNNRPQKESRWSMGLILGVLGLLVVIELLWLHEFFNWKILGEDFKLGLRPSYFLILVAFFTPFTSQNLYHQVRSVMNSQFVFVIFLAASAVIALSFAAVCLGTGDLLFTYTLDRMLAIFFTSVSIFYAFFIIANHGDLLKRKINFYYLMTQATDFSFFVVWLLSLGGIVVVEGMEKWKSITLISHTYTMNIGDEAWYEKNFQRSEKAYDLASRMVASSVKAHYNLANLSLQKSRGQDRAIREYEKAVSFMDFDYAWLNAAQLLNEKNLTDSATHLLEAAYSRMPGSAKIANNLGVNYWEGYMADSAISVIKRALIADPSDEMLHSHLGIIYHQNDRPVEAEDFIKASIEDEPDQKGVWTNYLVWRLAEGKKGQPKSLAYHEMVPTDFWLTYHHYLSQPEMEKDTLGLALLKRTANEANISEAILLDGWRLMMADSLELGESRLTFLANTSRDFASFANYLLGIAFYKEDMPAKARHYFQKQGEAGDNFGKLYAALMDLDMGFIDAANKALTRLRGEDEKLFESVSKELAIILKAYGQDLYAQTEWDLSTLDLNDRIRTGIFADSIGQFAYALENFRQAIEYDSTSVAPYLEMGRIYNRYRDPLSVTNLLFGLEKKPENKDLKREIALGYIKQNKAREALKYMDTLSTDPADRLVFGEWLLANGERERAEAVWETAFDENQMYRPLVLHMASYFKENDQYAQGYNLISKALFLNNKNPRYWYYLAFFAEGYGEEEEARLAREKVEELYPEGQEKEAVMKELR